jgi:hypothetical protein
MLSVAEASPRREVPPYRLVLRSTPLVCAAGLLQWARNGYTVARATEQPVAPFIQVFADGYRLGAVLAEQLLRGDIATSIDAGDVVLSLSMEEHHAYRVRQASLPDVPGGLVESFPVERCIA